MTSESAGVLLIAAGLALGCGGWIAWSAMRIYGRASRIWRAWKHVM